MQKCKCTISDRMFYKGYWILTFDLPDFIADEDLSHIRF